MLTVTLAWNSSSASAMQPEDSGVRQDMRDAFYGCMYKMAVATWSHLSQNIKQGFDGPNLVLQDCSVQPTFRILCLRAGNMVQDCDDAAWELAAQAVTAAGAKCDFGGQCN